MKIISLEDYLTRLINFEGDKAKEAIRLIYTENKVIATEEYKGRKFYIVEGEDAKSVGKKAKQTGK